MTEHPTWDRRLTPIADSDELCAPFGERRPCDGVVAYRLSYWSRQGRFRTPAESKRLLCAAHARRYVEMHGGAVDIGELIEGARRIA